MAKECAISTCNLLRGGLPRTSVDRITDRPGITLAVERGRKALTQPTKVLLIPMDCSTLPFIDFKVLEFYELSMT